MGEGESENEAICTYNVFRMHISSHTATECGINCLRNNWRLRRKTSVETKQNEKEPYVDVVVECRCVLSVKMISVVKWRSEDR